MLQQIALTEHHSMILMICMLSIAQETDYLYHLFRFPLVYLDHNQQYSTGADQHCIHFWSFLQYYTTHSTFPLCTNASRYRVIYVPGSNARVINHMFHSIGSCRVMRVTSWFRGTLHELLHQQCVSEYHLIWLIFYTCSLRSLVSI